MRYSRLGSGAAAGASAATMGADGGGGMPSDADCGARVAHAAARMRTPAIAAIPDSREMDVRMHAPAAAAEGSATGRDCPGWVDDSHLDRRASLGHRMHGPGVQFQCHGHPGNAGYRPDFSTFLMRARADGMAD